MLIKYILLLETIVLRAVSGHLVMTSPEPYGRKKPSTTLLLLKMVAISPAKYAQMRAQMRLRPLQQRLFITSREKGNCPRYAASNGAKTKR